MNEQTTPAVLTQDDGPVRILTLNRPERRNSLNLEDRLEFLAALRDAEADLSCRALVVTGAAPVFCSGGDISSMSPDPEMAAIRLKVVNDIVRQMVTTSLPIVAAIEGGAYGLGLALATACDYSVVAEDAKLTCSFGRIGLTADTGTFYTLPARVGPGRARELILTARLLSAGEGLDIGLISQVVPSGQALTVATERAQQLSRLSGPMIAATKRILAAPAQDLESVLAAEAAAQADLLAGADFAEGRAAFFERRPPAFSAPRPATHLIAATSDGPS